MSLCVPTVLGVGLRPAVPTLATVRSFGIGCFGLGLLALGTLGCGQSTAEATPSSAELEIYRGALTPRLVLSGRVVARESVDLVTPNANIFPVPLRWLADDGSLVSAGDPVVEFDNSQLVGQLENLESQLVEAGNQLISTRARVGNDLATAFFDLEKARAEEKKASLDAEIPEGILARQESERRQLEWRKARLAREAAERAYDAKREAGENDIAVQEIEVGKARSAVDRARRGIDVLAMEAPRDGIVLVARNPREDRPFRSGDNAFPGIPVVRMPDLATLGLEADLFDVDDGRITIGDQVEAVLDAFPGETLSGQITEIDTIADSTGRTSTRRTFRVRIVVDGLDPERVRPGMSARVTVHAEEIPELLVPRAALRWHDDATPHVVLADGSLVAVRLGVCDRDACVLDEGPPAGTALADSGG
ncbi:MAG: efflux RND transporter periplasmic adaptor subunit [Acidobacteriota bacterium]